MLKKSYTHFLGRYEDRFHDMALAKYKFLAANGSPIDVYGSAVFTIGLAMGNNDMHGFQQEFIIAEVADNIVGYDFLRRHNLAFNPCTETLTRMAGVPKTEKIEVRVGEMPGPVINVGGVVSCEDSMHACRRGDCNNKQVRFKDKVEVRLPLV